MPLTHNHMVLRAVQWLRAQGYHACLAEPTLTHELPDAIGWNARGGSSVIECKVSRSDFRADLKKPCHKAPEASTLGNFRWYMTPRGLVRPEEVPTGHGLLEITEKKVFIVVKAPRRQSHASSLERSMLAEALGRVQRDHFAEAFSCPEAYMDARIWVQEQLFSPEVPEDLLHAEETIVPPDPYLNSEAYRKVSCLDRIRGLSSRIHEHLYSRRILSGPDIQLSEVLEAVAHIRRTENLLAEAVRRSKVSSSQEKTHA